MEGNRNLEILEMRLGGGSREEIAKRFGLSPAQVDDVFKEIRQRLGGRNRNDLADICVFPALRGYIQENRINRKNLYRMLYMVPEDRDVKPGYQQIINHRVRGKVPFTSAEWLRLAQVTGIPLERLMDSGGKVRLREVKRK